MVRSRSIVGRDASCCWAAGGNVETVSISLFSSILLLNPLHEPHNMADTTVQPPQQQQQPPQQVNLPVLEDDDEFSEFDQEDWGPGDAGKLALSEWQDNWDDDEDTGSFAEQLRRELAKATGK